MKRFYVIGLCMAMLIVAGESLAAGGGTPAEVIKGYSIVPVENTGKCIKKQPDNTKFDFDQIVIKKDGVTKKSFCAPIGLVNIKIAYETKTNIYFLVAPDGIGGYYLFAESVARSLYRYNRAANTVTLVTKDALNVLVGKKIYSIEGAQKIYCDRTGKQKDMCERIVLRNLGTGKTANYTLPKPNFVVYDYYQFGGFSLSPDGNRLGMIMAKGDSQAEQGSVYILDIKTAKWTKVLDYKDVVPAISGWSKDNKTVLMK